jgi:cyclopropane fatty-acyl-phospholipid synthase-like methyltransferase
MTEFWEQAFQDKQEMWGWEPTQSALLTAELFARNGYKTILIPGIGYGRNAAPFVKLGMEVSGIEISEAAIRLASKQFGDAIQIHHGSVTDMPFDNHLYDGIYSHALIHLLDEKKRKELIAACYKQLNENGLMVFTTITRQASTYGQGIPISKDRFEQFGGVKLFFYDKDTILKDFEKFGLLEISELTENFPFYLIICQKQRTVS